MRISLRFTLALIVATLVPILGASPASASRTIELRGAERGVTSSGLVTFGNRPALEFETIACDVTLLKTLARSIPKIAGTAFGRVTGIAIDRGTAAASHCRIREITTLQDIVPLAGRGPGFHRELGGGVLLYDISGAAEWRIIYDGFVGVLPAIEGIDYHIQNARIRFDIVFSGMELRCLNEGSWYKRIQISRTGTAERLRIDLARTDLRSVEGGGLCLGYTASGELTLRPTLTIRLL